MYIKGCNVLRFLWPISQKMVQNGGGGAGYFRQKCRVISQNKYVFWLLNFI